MKISQAFTFEAAHHLPKVPPSHRCRRLHGHSYRVEIHLEGPVDSETGFLADFFDIEAVFQPVLAELDHFCLNDVPGLENPTAEISRSGSGTVSSPRCPISRPCGFTRPAIAGRSMRAVR